MYHLFILLLHIFTINFRLKVNQQLSDCRAAQFALEEDLAFKGSSIGIDSICHQLNNFSRGINYFGGIEKYDSSSNTAETWSTACNERIKRYKQVKLFSFHKLYSDFSKDHNLCKIKQRRLEWIVKRL